ncbi:MAG: GNAT family N-acetyltransferase [Arenicella sp.]
MISNEYFTCIEAQICNIDAKQWDAMNTVKQPFLSHAFLSGLETSACVCKQTGWQAQHIVIYQDRTKTTLLAAMPCYLKNHSYGEYIFDWAWADAYHRAGYEYYPKLSCATPFTPATTQKWLIHTDADKPAMENALMSALKQHAVDIKVSSIHALFTESDAAPLFTQNNFIQRSSSQFHWHNRNTDTTLAPFEDFNDFLQTMSSRKRKNIKKERQRVSDQGVSFQWFTGETLSESVADQIFAFYLSTVYRYGAQQYLNTEFFHHIVKSMPSHTHVLIAYLDGSAVAGGLFFASDSTLYGRYWGANADIKDLHFETCYYQPIDYAIKHQFKTFEAGAQGEHKLSRGLLPTTTYSHHWLADKAFRAAIMNYTETEAEHIEKYNRALGEHAPFKTNEPNSNQKSADHDHHHNKNIIEI